MGSEAVSDRPDPRDAITPEEASLIDSAVPVTRGELLALMTALQKTLYPQIVLLQLAAGYSPHVPSSFRDDALDASRELIDFTQKMLRDWIPNDGK